MKTKKAVAARTVETAVQVMVTAIQTTEKAPEKALQATRIPVMAKACHRPADPGTCESRIAVEMNLLRIAEGSFPVFLFPKMNAGEHSETLVYSGLSGLQLDIPKYLFPPPFEKASRLAYYASLFNSIEINSSFYKIPRYAMVARWSASVPEPFRFTFKLWKEITHGIVLHFNEEDVVAFLHAIDGSQLKKGCILVQFPPRLGKEYTAQLHRLLICLHEANKGGWKIAVEFRNKSWYNERTYRLLDQYKAALVTHDMPQAATPATDYEADFKYIRFHGPSGNYGESYPDAFLNEYASYISEWREAGKEVYVYFNNTRGDAINNLRTLNNLLQEKGVTM